MADQHSLVSRIKALAEALEGSDIEEMDLTEQGTRIVIRRALDPVVAVPRAAPGAGRGAARAAGAPAVPVADPTIAIITPLTGVYYASPSPSSPPYVQVGDTVRAGQVICLVEAMKVFNEITADVSGRVDSIPVQPNQLVHKGDALIRVRPV
ncbi:MAG TPA: biotin/lipoyl-containing protein [Ktedonobacterales bacterium]|jgi:acetyl-CoA carboxylase biotin carboxyl carrier protein